MLTNHLRIALRTLRRRRGTAVLNIVGLAIGLAVCFLIALWVTDELRYDRFHEKSDRIYRAVWEARMGDNEWAIPRVGAPLRDAMLADFPQVEAATHVLPSGRTFRLGEELRLERNVFFVDTTFFDIMNVRLVEGDHASALRDADALVMTTEMAERYFGTSENVLGREMELASGTILRVTAVAEKWPAHSHFHFDFLAPLHHNPATRQQFWQGWQNGAVLTYFLLREGTDPAAFERQMNATWSERFNWQSSAALGENYTWYRAQALTDIHLRSDLEHELAAGGNITYVYLFGAIGLFILLLAGINYVNLTTAHGARRAREVGVRKTMGSGRRELMWQFFAESGFSVALAGAAAAMLAWLVLPAFNQLAGKDLTLLHFGAVPTLLMLLAIIAAAAFLAGGYPALYLSSFSPARALRGETVAGGRRGLRSALVVAQFTVSIALIVGTLVVQNQMRYVQSAELGFDREHVLVIPLAGLLGQQQRSFLEEVKARPQVVSASAASNLPGQTFDSTIFAPEQPANFESTSISYAWIDPDYTRVLGLQMAEGRAFSREFASDSMAFVINRAAARALGWDEPLGRQLNMGNFVSGPVVGVVEDFNFQSLHHEVRPMIFMQQRWTPQNIAVRLAPGDVAGGIAAVRGVWEEFLPGRAFEYSFLDQDYGALYEAETRMASVFNIFSVLAILIACLGLFGLAAFTAEQRTKEIGVRKVLGASVPGIVTLLARDFVMLVAIAFFVAVPLSWFGMRQWLDDFAYRVEIGPTVFLAAGLLALAIAFVTVSWHAWRAAASDPVKSLRYE
jgi:putative ABC transport system permease protein